MLPFSPRQLPKSECFSKEKTEKKKAQEVCQPKAKRKRNKSRRVDKAAEQSLIHYAVVFWQPSKNHE